MIPSPFTAELARDHQSTLVARASSRPLHRSLRRPRVTALLALVHSVRTRPLTTACAAC